MVYADYSVGSLHFDAEESRHVNQTEHSLFVATDVIRVGIRMRLRQLDCLCTACREPRREKLAPP